MKKIFFLALIKQFNGSNMRIFIQGHNSKFDKIQVCLFNQALGLPLRLSLLDSFVSHLFLTF